VFKVVVERKAEKDLDRLATVVYRRVREAIHSLAENPRPQGCCRLAGTATDWRLRVGDYRIIYEISDAVRIVQVTRVRHRREVYR
jgi:mRNA interferase RelE/StbE